MSLHEKFGKAWRRLSELTTSGDRLARIEASEAPKYELRWSHSEVGL